MEIYSYDIGLNSLMNLIYVIAAVVFGVGLFFAIKLLVFPLLAAKRDGEKAPILVTVLSLIIVLIPLIGFLGAGNLFFKSVTYENDMKNGKAQVLVGEVELLSYQEVYTRGEGMHYVVELRIGDQTISPSNAFYKEDLEHFEGGEKMMIEYGIIRGDGLYIWSIKTVNE